MGVIELVFLLINSAIGIVASRLASQYIENSWLIKVPFFLVGFCILPLIFYIFRLLRKKR